MVERIRFLSKQPFPRKKAQIFALIASLLVLCIYTDVRFDGVMEALESGKTNDAVYALSNTEKYILKEYEGRIGIFSEGKEVPTEILGVYVFTLPKADQNALRVGITVYGLENLRSLIEDFTA